jgi:PAS domain S-box-containing protein
MKRVQRMIEDIGYTENEAIVYLTTFLLGYSQVVDIAKNASLPRSTVTVTLDNLKKRKIKDGFSLITSFKIGKDKFWSAENPERFLDIYKLKETKISEIIKRIKELKNNNTLKGKNEDKKNEIIKIFGDSIGNPTLITSTVPEVLYVNEKWEKLFQYKLDDILGKNPSFVSSGKTDATVYAKFWKTILSGNIFNTNEVVNKRKDGTLVNVDTTFFSIKLDGISCYVQIINSFTERDDNKNVVN